MGGAGAGDDIIVLGIETEHGVGVLLSATVMVYVPAGRLKDVASLAGISLRVSVPMVTL